jgi:hypothetical protein
MPRVILDVVLSICIFTCMFSTTQGQELTSKTQYTETINQLLDQRRSAIIVNYTPLSNLIDPQQRRDKWRTVRSCSPAGGTCGCGYDPDDNIPNDDGCDHCCPGLRCSNAGACY